MEASDFFSMRLKRCSSRTRSFPPKKSKLTVLCIVDVQIRRTSERADFQKVYNIIIWGGRIWTKLWHQNKIEKIYGSGGYPERDEWTSKIDTYQKRSVEILAKVLSLKIWRIWKFCKNRKNEGEGVWRFLVIIEFLNRTFTKHSEIDENLCTFFFIFNENTKRKNGFGFQVPLKNEPAPLCETSIRLYVHKWKWGWLHKI